MSTLVTGSTVLSGFPPDQGLPAFTEITKSEVIVSDHQPALCKPVFSEAAQSVAALLADLNVQDLLIVPEDFLPTRGLKHDLFVANLCGEESDHLLGQRVSLLSLSHFPFENIQPFLYENASKLGFWLRQVNFES